MKKLRYDPRSIRFGLTLVTLLCWILPILIIVTMCSVLVNYYNDRNLEQARELGMENAMHQVELRLLSVIEDSKAVSYDGIVRQSYSEASGLVYKDVTEYLTQKFTRNANYRCVFISSASGGEPVHAYAAPGTAKLNLLRNYKTSVYPEVKALLEQVDTGIYFLTVGEEIYMVRNLLDHDFMPYAMLVLGLEKSEVFQSLYGIANVSITGVSIDGIALPGADYTWEQFLADCQTIRGNGLAPIACSLIEMPHYWFEFAVLNRGGVDAHLQLPRLDGSGALADNSVSEAWIAGLEDLRLLYEQGFFAENTLTAGDAETVAMFGDGEAAFLLDGSWKVGFFSENYADRLDDFAVCCVPAQSGRKPSETIGGISTGYFITRKAWDDPEKREAAVAFVSQLTSASACAGICSSRPKWTSCTRRLSP